MADDFFRKLSLGTNLRRPPVNATRDTAQHLEVKTRQQGNSNRDKARILTDRDEINRIRKKYRIKVKGADVPAPLRGMSSLCLLNIDTELIKALQYRGIRKLTPVQRQAIPLIVNGRDAIITAPTGTGKTFSYLIPIISQLLTTESLSAMRVLIIAPTRELADQICKEARQLTNHIKIFYLNKSLFNSWQSSETRSFPDILVSTPMRFIQAVQKKILAVDSLKYFVIDEVDRLLDKSFLEQMDAIVQSCSGIKGVQKMVLSATIPTGIEDLARTFLLDPVRVTIGRLSSDISRRIKQSLIYVGRDEGKLMAVKQMVTSGVKPPVIIFCNCIERCKELHQMLKALGLAVDSIHSQRSQSEREAVIRAFRDGTLWFLITTDILSRGLDFPNVPLVINYDYPDSTASYIHRIGRTGRAECRGKAVTFYTDSDIARIKVVVNVMQESGCDTPDWLLELARKTK